MILVWFVLADGTELASQVVALPRPGDVVRFAPDGEVYDVTQIEHIATTARPRLGTRYTKIVIRLSPAATRRC